MLLAPHPPPHPPPPRAAAGRHTPHGVCLPRPSTAQPACLQAAGQRTLTPRQPPLPLPPPSRVSLEEFKAFLNERQDDSLELFDSRLRSNGAGSGEGGRQRQGGEGGEPANSSEP